MLAAVDGRRTYEEIAEVVSHRYGRLLSADDAHTLCDSKLRTIGVLRLADGASPRSGGRTRCWRCVFATSSPTRR